jgi:hypothetical protein
MHTPPQLHNLSQPQILLDQRIILMKMNVLEAAHELHRLLANQMVLILLDLFLVNHTLLTDLKLQKARDHHFIQEALSFFLITVPTILMVV